MQGTACANGCQGRIGWVFFASLASVGLSPLPAVNCCAAIVAYFLHLGLRRSLDVPTACMLSWLATTRGIYTVSAGRPSALGLKVLQKTDWIGCSMLLQYTRLVESNRTELDPPVNVMVGGCKVAHSTRKQAILSALWPCRYFTQIFPESQARSWRFISHVPNLQA